MFFSCLTLGVPQRASDLSRDIKPANLLLDRRGVLKLADFGYALAIRLLLTRRCRTRRAFELTPELLFGASHYDGFALDVWSAGCIFVELFLGRPLFRGEDESDQLANIFCLRSPDRRDVARRFLFEKNTSSSKLNQMR